MKNINSAPTYTISLSDQIYCFELSSYEKSQNLAVVAVVNKIILGLIKFPVRSYYGFLNLNNIIIFCGVFFS